MAETVPVELKIADREPFLSFVKSAGDAAAMFATLTDAERDGLPSAALFGIARLRGAIAEFAEPEAPAVPREPDGAWAGKSFLAGLGSQEGNLARMMDRLAKDTVRSMQKPSIGRVVHYVSHGSPVREDGTQAYKSECRAAVITEIYYQHTYDETGAKAGPSEPDPEQRVSLAVLNPTGMFFSHGIPFDDGHSGGSWHWPERTES